MYIRRALFAAAGIWCAATIAASAHTARPQAQAQGQRSGGWTLPDTAADEKNPFANDPKAAETGKALFKKHCERCHGPGGKGDGPDGDPDNEQDMDLTVARRAARNPDGVVFYKAWNGRTKPKMPAVKDDLTKEQLWQIVSYVQTLRQKS
ncbi:MAG TPA: c-type cytochrome [Vicinamibacterales bacterium]|jgi:mono/diheme cytochrome c family protein